MQSPLKQPRESTQASNRPAKTRDNTTAKSLHNKLIQQMTKTLADPNRLLPRQINLTNDMVKVLLQSISSQCSPNWSKVSLQSVYSTVILHDIILKSELITKWESGSSNVSLNTQLSDSSGEDNQHHQASYLMFL